MNRDAKIHYANNSHMTNLFKLNNLIPLVLGHRPKMDQSTFLSVFLGAAIGALARKRVEGKRVESNMDEYPLKG